MYPYVKVGRFSCSARTPTPLLTTPNLGLVPHSPPRHPRESPGLARDLRVRLQPASFGDGRPCSRSPRRPPRHLPQRRPLPHSLSRRMRRPVTCSCPRNPVSWQRSYFDYLRPAAWVSNGSARRARLPNLALHLRIAVGRLLLQSFWSNEAIFQLMILAYNLFLLFKIDLVKTTEYRQQIKSFPDCQNYHPLSWKIRKNHAFDQTLVGSHPSNLCS